jgi:hypothetical protein
LRLFIQSLSELEWDFSAFASTKILPDDIIMAIENLLPYEKHQEQASRIFEILKDRALHKQHIDIFELNFKKFFNDKALAEDTIIYKVFLKLLRIHEGCAQKAVVSLLKNYTLALSESKIVEILLSGTPNQYEELLIKISEGNYSAEVVTIAVMLAVQSGDRDFIEVALFRIHQSTLGCALELAIKHASPDIFLLIISRCHNPIDAFFFSFRQALRFNRRDIASSIINCLFQNDSSLNIYRQFFNYYWTGKIAHARSLLEAIQLPPFLSLAFIYHSLMHEQEEMALLILKHSIFPRKVMQELTAYAKSINNDTVAQYLEFLLTHADSCSFA